MPVGYVIAQLKVTNPEKYKEYIEKVPEVIKKYNNRLGDKIDHFQMEFWKMFEIDNLQDLRICSLLMKEFLIKQG